MAALGAALVIGGAAGCGGADPQGETVGSSASRVQGGTTDTTHTFAVAVFSMASGGMCSGALIAPNLVVTARHCLTESPTVINCATANFGEQASPGDLFVTTDAQVSHEGNWRGVQRIYVPASKRVCGNDIALLILDSMVPESEATPVVPAVQYPITDHSRYATENTAIGYGLSDPQDPSTSGIRRIRTNIPIECIPDDPEIDCYGPPRGDPSVKAYIKETEFLSGNGTCQGDSGSSAFEQTSFDQGNPVSLGVLSRGGLSSDGKTCIGAVYTRLDSWKDLVRQAAFEAAELGGYPVPYWMKDPPPEKPSRGDATIGESCGADEDCASGICRGLDEENFICTEECTSSETCPDGFGCIAGYCFPQEPEPEPEPEPAPSPSSSGSRKNSGCSVAVDPSKPVPWKALALGLGVAVVAARRRRGR